MKQLTILISLTLGLSQTTLLVQAETLLQTQPIVFKAGHASLQQFRLPVAPPYPSGNAPTPQRVALGKALFFDPRLSGTGSRSCATCHNPGLGWSDGQKTALGVRDQFLGRATPGLVNVAYNPVQLWDGRSKSLEDQVLMPIESRDEMNMDLNFLLQWIGNNQEYQSKFGKAYPGEAINPVTVAKAIASFERTLVSRNAPFDQWVAGNPKAMTQQQVAGFKLFAGKAHCLSCHSGPNFTDNGFHNLGLASWGDKDPDMGRYVQKPVNAMKGAFKTPTLRDIASTAPYFHDGSAKNLLEVVEHYNSGGVVKTNLSPEIKPLNLDAEEKQALVAFMQALSSPRKRVVMPELPEP